jgi:hypothetical protein
MLKFLRQCTTKSMLKWSKPMRNFAGSATDLASHAPGAQTIICLTENPRFHLFQNSPRLKTKQKKLEIDM